MRKVTVYNWLCLLGIPGLFASLFAFFKTQMGVNKAIKLGMQAILRDRLLQSYRYFSQKGYAEPDDRMNFENMYAQYHSLGANGVMDDVHNKFLALPLYDSKKGQKQNEKD